MCSVSVVVCCSSSSAQGTAQARACRANVLTVSTVRQRPLVQRPSCLAAVPLLSFSYVSCAWKNLGTWSWELLSSHFTCSTCSSRVPASNRFKFYLRLPTRQQARGIAHVHCIDSRLLIHFVCCLLTRTTKVQRTVPVPTTHTHRDTDRNKPMNMLYCVNSAFCFSWLGIWRASNPCPA